MKSKWVTPWKQDLIWLYERKAFIVRCFARVWSLHNKGISSNGKACHLFVRLIINQPGVGMRVFDCNIKETGTTECHWLLSTTVFSVINLIRNVSRIPATFKTEFFVILVNDWKPLTNLTRSFILDAAGVNDTPLIFCVTYFLFE